MSEIKPQNAADPAPDAPAGAPAVILVNPQLGENIGTAARAMANFALDDLRLVNPRDGWPSDKALGAAAGASRVSENATVHADCAGGIADLNIVYVNKSIVEMLTTAEAFAMIMSRLGATTVTSTPASRMSAS